MRKTFFILSTCLFAVSAVSQVVSVPSLKANAPAYASTDDEGILEVVLSEDFSLMTEGAEGAPSESTIEDDKLSIPDSLTHTPGWQGYFLRQAGGCLYIGLDSKEIDSGAVNTPKVDVSKAAGAFTVRFRAKSAVAGYEDRLYVDSKINSSTYVTKEVKITDQWQEYAVMFENGTASTYVLFYPYIEAAYIDDISLEVMIPYVAAPTSLAFNDYTVTGFTATWAPVEGATGYFFNVFTKDADGNRNYAIENLPLGADVCSYAVENLPETDSFYYFTVRATDGVHKSPESMEVAVEGLLRPELEAEIGITENGFTASWKPVAHALSYNIIATREHTAAEDGVYYIVNQDFENITGEENSSYDYTSIPELPGWTIASPTFLAGEVGVVSFNGQYGNDAWIQSSIYDFSNNSGKVRLVMDVYCNHKKYTSDILVGLYTYDESAGRYVAQDYRTIKAVGKDGALIDVEFTGGGKQSLIMIQPDGYADMMIRDLKLSQDLKAGDRVDATVASLSTTNTYVTLSNLDILPGDKVRYVVRAVGRNSGDTRYIYSDYTDPRYVEFTTSGIDAVGDDTAGVFTVYNLQGLLVVKEGTAADLSGLPAGIYIVNGKKRLIRK